MRISRGLLVATVALGLLLVSACSQGATPPPGVDAAPVAPPPATHSQFTLPATELDGIGVVEVSGLAWDADEKLLYAVSDRGYVYHFRIQRDGNTIAAIQAVSASALSDPMELRDGASSRKRFNAEGLAVQNGDNGIRGDSELVVALEEKPPQIARFSPAGELLGMLPVPPPANDIDNYQKKGRGLEAVALHPDFGLMTAPEAPLRGRPPGMHTIYAEGHEWSFPRQSSESRLKGFDALPDGKLLILERTRPGSGDTQIASLRRVDLASCQASGTCSAEVIVTLPPAAQNFEGMTPLDPRHVLLASDNGGNAPQTTTFVLIELP